MPLRQFHLSPMYLLSEAHIIIISSSIIIIIILNSFVIQL